VTATVQYAGKFFTLANLSVVILDQRLNVIYNTSDGSHVFVKPTAPPRTFAGPFKWDWWQDTVGISIPGFQWDGPRPVEQLKFTQDLTDYAWYSRSLVIPLTLVSPNLTVNTSQSSALVVFLDGQQVANGYDLNKGMDTMLLNITLPNIKPGTYRLDILSISLGIENGGLGWGLPGMELSSKGIVGEIWLGPLNLTVAPNLWRMQKGVLGEELEVFTVDGTPLVPWKNNSYPPAYQPVTWFRTFFKLSSVQKNPLALDLSVMNRGHAYVNGYDLGRYWLLSGSCTSDLWCGCSFAECGKPSQSLYHIPPDWLRIGDNLITIFEELGTFDVSGVSVVIY